jgi:hypothetical protein
MGYNCPWSDYDDFWYDKGKKSGKKAEYNRKLIKLLNS